MEKNKCEYCKYRYSWDCDDGLPYPKGGCENFELDKSTLTENEKRMFEIVGLMKTMGGGIKE